MFANRAFNYYEVVILCDFRITWRKWWLLRWVVSLWWVVSGLGTVPLSMDWKLDFLGGSGLSPAYEDSRSDVVLPLGRKWTLGLLGLIPESGIWNNDLTSFLHALSSGGLPKIDYYWPHLTQCHMLVVFNYYSTICTRLLVHATY